MRLLVVVAEGQSEEEYVGRALAPHLRHFGVSARPQVLGTGGGVDSYDGIRTDVSPALEDAERADGYVTTMLDLYALPRDFPGRREAPSGDPRRKVKFLENALWDAFGRSPRLVPYIQLHEFEALVLANLPRLLAMIAQQASADEADVLEETRQRFHDLGVTTCDAGGPELVDEGNPPSRRIDDAGGELLHYPGNKVTYGAVAASDLCLALMRERCPHFGAWVSRLEKLGAAAGA